MNQIDTLSINAVRILAADAIRRQIPAIRAFLWAARLSATSFGRTI